MWVQLVDKKIVVTCTQNPNLETVLHTAEQLVGWNAKFAGDKN